MVEKGPCPEPRDGCKYYERGDCHLSIHHKYWPAKWYIGHIAMLFRHLPENKEVLPRCEHDELHFTTPPPEKPTLEEMKKVVY